MSSPSENTAVVYCNQFLKYHVFSQKLLCAFSWWTIMLYLQYLCRKCRTICLNVTRPSCFWTLAPKDSVTRHALFERNHGVVSTHGYYLYEDSLTLLGRSHPQQYSCSKWLDAQSCPQTQTDLVHSLKRTTCKKTNIEASHSYKTATNTYSDVFIFLPAVKSLASYEIYSVKHQAWPRMSQVLLRQRMPKIQVIAFLETLQEQMAGIVLYREKAVRHFIAFPKN